MERRKFIKITGLAGASMIALPSIAYAFTDYKEAAAGVIAQELDYLKLDKGGVAEFVNDYYKDHYIVGNETMQFKLKAYYYLKVKSDDSYLVWELVNNFLLSSDFFINKMDESKTVKYVGLYTPYLRPCSHPFSASYYPATTV